MSLRLKLFIVTILCLVVVLLFNEIWLLQPDKDKSELVKINFTHAVDEAKKNTKGYETGDDALGVNHKDNSLNASELIENDDLKSLSNNAINREIGSSEKPNSVSSEKKLENVMKEVPANYHSVLYWESGQDDELINEYSKVIKGTDVIEFENSLEQNFPEFIYQHELSIQISIESLDCNYVGCIVYGTEMQTGTWNQLIEVAKKQAWWRLSVDSTRSSVGADGKLIFFTIIRS
jgi:hypothetical protein